MPSTVGEHIRSVRRERGLRQVDVAVLLGVTPVTVLHWERNATAPTPKDGPSIVAFLAYLPLPITTLAEQLYAVRFVNGWTQAEAATASGVSEDGWRAWEGGATPTRGKRALLENVVETLQKTPLGLEAT